MSNSTSDTSAQRNMKHMRRALGFYPFAKERGTHEFELINARIVDWLKSKKISGHNARDNFGLIAEFCETLATDLYEKRVLDTLNECYSLAFASTFSAMGSFESYLSYKRKRDD